MIHYLFGQFIIHVIIFTVVLMVDNIRFDRIFRLRVNGFLIERSKIFRRVVIVIENKVLFRGRKIQSLIMVDKFF